MRRLLYLICFQVLFFPFAKADEKTELANQILRKTFEFYQKLEKEKKDKSLVLKNDDILSQLSKNDFYFLSSRLKNYGMAPFRINNTMMVMDNLEVDFNNVADGILIIQGLPYHFNLSMNLEDLYKKEFKTQWKKHKQSTSSFWDFALAPLSLSGCVPSEQLSKTEQEKRILNVGVALSYTHVCCDALEFAHPAALAADLSVNLTKSLYVAKNEGAKAGAVNFCKNLPGVRSLIEVCNSHKAKKDFNESHSGK